MNAGGKIALFISGLSLLLSACTPEGGTESPGATSVLAPPARFIERAVESGIAFRHTDGSSGKYYIVETLASGVGLLDFDADGDLDIYFPNGRPLPPVPEDGRGPVNALFENDGRGTFTDVTREKGVPGVGFSVGCCAGDYDGDGDLDLYVAGFGRNVLYRNEGSASGYAFTDVTAEAGVDDPRFSAGCAFLDHDRDGDLDLYVANYCEVDFASSKPCLHHGVPGYCAPGIYKPVHDSFFENRGDGTFRDVSRAAGVVRDPDPGPKWGMGVVACDFNDDGWIDIYVANDVSDNFLLENQRDGTFRHVALDRGVAVSTDGSEQGSMGVDAGDFDGDGRFDIIVTNFQNQLNALYRNDGELGFTDQALGKGLGESTLPMVSWGTKFFDFDSDGWGDLFIANGHLEDRIDQYDQTSWYLQRNQLFQSAGGERFVEVTSTAGPGFDERFSSRGAAFGDLDGDGDVDIVVSNSRDRPSLLINETPNANSWVVLELRGKRNRFAIGARVRLTAGGRVQVGEVQSGGSYASQNDLRLHFGLGRTERIDRVEVRWPEGATSTHEGLETRAKHVLQEP